MTDISFVNGCVFNAASNGTGNFVFGSSIEGWMDPINAGAIDGMSYRYRAALPDGSQWEIGTGTYTSSPATLTRTNIIRAGETFPGGGTSIYAGSSITPINFTAPPQVSLTSFAEDILASNVTTLFSNSTISDPGSDQILFWDDSANTVTWLTPSTGIVISNTSITVDNELAALASLTSAADLLPYFTGSGTANTTTLTSFARTLLDDANAAAMQTTLGLSLAGLGGAAVSLATPDLNADRADGFYYCNSPTNSPTGANGWLNQSSISSAYKTQTYSNSDDGSYWHRVELSGVWHAWVCVHPGLGTTTDNAIVRFDGINGGIQNSVVTISDTGNITTAGTINAGGGSLTAGQGDTKATIHGTAGGSNLSVLEETENVEATFGTFSSAHITGGAGLVGTFTNHDFLIRRANTTKVTVKSDSVVFGVPIKISGSASNLFALYSGTLVSNYGSFIKYDGSAAIGYIGGDGGAAISGGNGSGFAVVGVNSLQLFAASGTAGLTLTSGVVAVTGSLNANQAVITVADSSASVAASFRNSSSTYDLYVDNVGTYGTNRCWLNTTTTGEVQFGPRGGSTGMAWFRVRATYASFETGNVNVVDGTLTVGSGNFIGGPIPTSSTLPVGCWTACRNNSGATVTNGSLIAGSSLQAMPYPGVGGTLTGTWRNVTGTDTASGSTGLFVRVS